MTELTGMFGYPRVDALTFLPSVVTDTNRYQKEFANAMRDGVILDSMSLGDFVTRQQFAPGDDVQQLLQTLQRLNGIEFTVENKKRFVGSDPFVVHQTPVVYSIVKPVINALKTMNESGSIHLKGMEHRNPEKMMLIKVGGWMVGDAVTYRDDKYLVAAINSCEKDHEVVFEADKPLLLINERLKKAVVVSPRELGGNEAL